MINSPDTGFYRERTAFENDSVDRIITTHTSRSNKLNVLPLLHTRSPWPLAKNVAWEYVCMKASLQNKTWDTRLFPAKGGLCKIVPESLALFQRAK